MKICHSVDAEPVVNIHMSHVHHILPVNNGYRWLLILTADPIIQNLNNGHKLRHHLFQISNRPFLQRLSQNGMIGISTGLLYDLHCLVKVNSPLHEQPDQFRNHHRRMSIIDLNHRIIRQVMKGTALFHTLIQNQLGPITDHKILLIDAKLPPCLIAVIRI